MRVVQRENVRLQSKKIGEIAEALIEAGYLNLDEQAKALGLPRSTTWTILRTKHKNSGLTGSVVKQMLAQPQLPRLVRAKIVEYVEQKLSGVYGHTPQRIRRFSSGLDGMWAGMDQEAKVPAEGSSGTYGSITGHHFGTPM